MFDSVQSYELWSARLLYPWDSPGKNTGVGCHVDLAKCNTDFKTIASFCSLDRVTVRTAGIYLGKQTQHEMKLTQIMY